MPYIIKKSKVAPATGNIIDTMSINSDTNAPSINAVKNIIYKPNLLINGDFQINQRGKDTYINGGFTVDMWKTSASANVLVVNNGYVTLKDNSGGVNNVSLSQIIESIEPHKKYTISMKLKNDTNVYSITTTPNNNYNEYVKDGIKIQFFYTSKKVALFLDTKITNTADFEYIYLTEGDVVFSHIKEEYSVALMRSKKHLRNLGYSFNGYIAGSSRTVYVPFNNSMNSNATIILGNKTVSIASNGTLYKTTTQSVTISRTDIIIVLPNDFPQNVLYVPVAVWFTETLLITSEPQ